MIEHCLHRQSGTLICCQCGRAESEVDPAFECCPVVHYDLSERSGAASPPVAGTTAKENLNVDDLLLEDALFRAPNSELATEILSRTLKIVIVRLWTLCLQSRAQPAENKHNIFLESTVPTC